MKLVTVGVSNHAAKASARGKFPDGENVVRDSKNMGSLLTSMFGVTFEKGDVTDSSAHPMRLCLNHTQHAQAIAATP